MNILAVGCHPDDLEIACGGTIAKYAGQGHKVFMCHVASGNLGHKVIPPAELVDIRRGEAAKAAKILGAEMLAIEVGDTMVNGYDESVVDRMIDIVRYAKPDVIITHNPEDYMRDHVETGKLVFNASFSASLVHRVTEHEAFDAIPPILYMEPLAGMNFIPTEYVDISGVIDQKLEALACHDSQIGWMREHDHIDFIDFVRTCSKYRGLQCGAAFAEGFRPCTNWPRIAARRLLP
ncbi:MAG: PIG-L family deacetylase [Clostridia bacterium]|nr:PIG-L family deacetylase [Clostridia bacterium]